MKKKSFITFLIFISCSYPKIIIRKSKIKVVLILFFCVLIISMLSGCDELIGNNNYGTKLETNPNESIIDKKVEVVGYNVTTQFTSGCKCDNTFKSNIKLGFYHTVHIGSGATYNIKGEILNIAEREIAIININILFLNNNNTTLFDSNLLNASYQILNLSQGESETFLITVKPEQYYYYDNPDFYRELRDNFLKVESLKFDISIY